VIRIIANKNINKQSWNEAVSRHENQFNWFMNSSYLDALSPRWMALVYGNYEAVFPLFNRHIFSKTFYQPFFTRAFAVLGSEDSGIQEQMNHMLRSLKAKGGFAIEESDFLEPNAVCQKLDVALCTLSNNTKRSIKKANSASLNVSEISIKDYLKFYKIETSKRIKGYKKKHFAMLLRILESEQAKGRLILRSVNKNGELLAVAALLQHADKALYLCAAINDAGKKLGASHFLVHQLIQENKSTWSELDFGGSNVEGVARFYKSFGAKDVAYTQIQLGK
jgi:hypothetical protein